MNISTLMLLILGLALLASGCMLDFAQLYALTMQPQPKTVTVESQRPTAFTCSTSLLPGASGAPERCRVCRNITAVTQGIAIVGSPVTVSPGVSVAKCASWTAPQEQGR